MDVRNVIINLEEASDVRSLGGKAVGLGMLVRAGFRVPGGFVLSRELSEAVLRDSGVFDEVMARLKALTRDNIRRTSEQLMALTEDLALPAELTAAIRERLEKHGAYAVRSSGVLEDLDDASFAGQYTSYLDVGIAAVPEKIIGCIRSMWHETVLSYLVDQGLDPAALGMAVIVQDMVPAEVAGVAFSVNPNTGNDREIVIEAVKGLGDQLVAGRAIPESISYDWFEDEIRTGPGAELLSRGRIRILGKGVLRIQKLFGYPVDVEFAVARNRNYALQVRPVTRIHYSAIEDQWTTADFKDGGVSARACKTLMWSLYEYVWETELKRFLLESGIMKEKELRKLSRILYGRPYWNMSVVKEAMSKVPGFKERDFDAEFGVTRGYEGDGLVTRIGPASVGRLAKIALHQRRILKERERDAESLKTALLESYQATLEAVDHAKGAELKKAWIRLVRDQYLKSEGTYFWQIFINTIHLSINRDAVMKYADTETYHSLIGGLSNVSHLRPYYELWELSRSIRRDEDALRFWLKTDAGELARAVIDGQEPAPGMAAFRQILTAYAYHSERELDISWPSYGEDPGPLISSLKDLLQLSDEYSPQHHQRRVHEEYLEALSRIGREHGSGIQGQVREKVEKIRELLWWREEFRDVSTRYYHLVRQYSRKLGRLLTEEGVFQEPADIWFLKMQSIIDLLEGTVSPEKAARQIKRNRSYYESFRNFMSDDEIGEGFRPLVVQPGQDVLARGVPGSRGQVKGIARVIQGLPEMDQIQPGDILVTKYTDTGWTSKFALLSGVVTEFGGALCHAAIVSREYGIPCIVGVKGAMGLISDGDTIIMDGATGEIRKEDETVCSSESTTAP